MASGNTGSRNKSTRNTSRSGKSRTSTASRKNTARSRAQQAEEERRAREVRRDIRLLVLFAAMVFLFISALGYGGPAGAAVSSVMFGLFGMMAYVLPLFIFFLVMFTVSNFGRRTLAVKCFAMVILFLTIGVFFELYSGALTPMTQYSAQQIYQRCAAAKAGGGLISGSAAYGLYKTFKTAGATLILIVISISCLLIITQHSVTAALKRAAEKRGSREKSSLSFWEKRRQDMELAAQDAAERREESRKRRREMEEQKAALLEKRKEELRKEKADASGLDLENTRMRAKGELAEEQEFGAFEDPGLLRRKNVSINPQPAERPQGGTASKPAVSSPEPDGNTKEPFFVLREEPSAAESSVQTDSGASMPDETAVDFEDLSEVRDTGVTELTVFNAADQKSGVEDRPEFPFEKEGPRTTATRRVRTVYATSPGIGSGITGKDAATNTPDYDREPVFDEEPIEITEETVFEEETEQKETAAKPAARPAERPAERPAISEEDLKGIEVHRDRGEEESGAGKVRAKAPAKARQYTFPSYDLMRKGVRDTDPDTDRILKENGYILQDTLRTFGVNVTITAISQGPSVTRYELILETGVKVSKIVSLADNIKLSLGATEVRIEAPIPGKKAIGIEVPNKKTTLVTLRDILESKEFINAGSKLTFAAGKDISGKTVVADIAKMPHLLIAGATGSGKSVCINTIILSLLYKATPEEVKMIMIDPKVVELSIYNGIPHLMIPVVTDAKKASAALGWAAAEMDKRYKLFAQAGVRDLNGYNHWVNERIANHESGDEKVLPRLVIIVDELADLMMIARNEVETTICRLLQLARAAGIHMIIATQRPSVDVITGLIKSNMPSRIAFAVASQVDSRTILDMAGAEKLIGKGDMLFYPQSYPKPVRLQGAFVSDEEVEEIVSYIKDKNPAVVLDEEVENAISNMAVPTDAGTGTGGDMNDRWDEHFEEAGRFVIDKDKASIGLLQRVFKIGFNRAARIMDQLCEAGVVSEESGTKARQVLMTMPEFESYLESQK